MTTTLERATFATSRTLEFFSEKELTLQIGAAPEQWPLALVKELIDNALDACESAGIQPEITIMVTPDTIAVQDNGPGLPESTLLRSLDYLVRVSDKSYYVSPTRGQLGNGLKCVWAAPFVADGARGRIVVESGGTRSQVDVTVDRIAQAPQLVRTTEPSEVKTGTRLTMIWPQGASYLNRSGSVGIYQSLDLPALLRAYCAFNPSATFGLVRSGTDPCIYEPTATERLGWRPTAPTSPHWYTPERLRALIAAYVAAEGAGERTRTVRELVAEFAGLSGSAKRKAVTDAAGLTACVLRDVVHDGDIDMDATERLLVAMQRESRALKPAVLGAIDEHHLRETLVADYFVAADTVRYKKVEGVVDGLPFVLEAAFGIHMAGFAECGRDLAVGLNWSPALRVPIRELYSMMAAQRIDGTDPVSLVVHLICPRLEYTDRGKTQIALPLGIRDALETCITAVAKSWKGLKRQADRDGRVSERDLEAERRAQQPQPLTMKDAAYTVMEDAYRNAAGSRPFAEARQVMYAARRLILNRFGRERWKHGANIWKNSATFTQGLLPDFIEEHPAIAGTWDVIYDARGHLIEPHTRVSVGLGTREVRRYIETWPLGGGPRHRFAYALFIEKEGFSDLLAAAEIAERFDLAIFSTKGVSVTAARALIDHLCQQGVIVLAARDFDRAGFIIARTLRDSSRRYQFDEHPTVIDIGLRLADVQAMGLMSEPVDYGSDPLPELRRCGASPEERAFLVERRTGPKSWTGQRVELNAMDNDLFIVWLEQKLREVGVHKVVPASVTLETAYRETVQAVKRQAVIDAAIRQALEGFVDAPVDLPSDLRMRVEAALPVGTAGTWEAIVRGYAKAAADGGA